MKKNKQDFYYVVDTFLGIKTRFNLIKTDNFVLYRPILHLNKRNKDLMVVTNPAMDRVEDGSHFATFHSTSRVAKP